MMNTRWVLVPAAIGIVAVSLLSIKQRFDRESETTPTSIQTTAEPQRSGTRLDPGVERSIGRSANDEKNTGSKLPEVNFPSTDRWAVFKKGLNSSNPREIFLSIEAAKECSGLQSSDLSTLINQVQTDVVSDKNQATVRLNAAKSFLAMCSGFAQQNISTDIADMWRRLTMLAAAEGKAHEFVEYSHSVGLGKAIAQQRELLCELFSQSDIHPGIVNELLPLLHGLVFKNDPDLSNPDNHQMRAVAIDQAICAANGSCEEWRANRVMLCALAGECDPVKRGLTGRGGLSEEQWSIAASKGKDLANRLQDRRNCHSILGG
jgi:hypothetical protein